MFVNIGNGVEPRRMFMNVRLCECIVCRNGKTSIVDYRILSFFLLSFFKKTKVVFFLLFKNQNHYRTCSLHFNIVKFKNKPFRFASSWK
jgi:hypothetical protein